MTELFGSVEQVFGGEARCCLLNGDCIDFLRTLPDCSVDSIVDDPPAGISFMGTEFDSDKGGRDNWIAWLTEIARESLRVLKPGGYHITWALPRTSHWTATAIENAGFEIRDIVTHVFGCLSEDTEILMDGRWEPYQKCEAGRLAMCYDSANDSFSWQPISEVVSFAYSDSAIRIYSDNTDQLVTPEHRCPIERSGAYAFIEARELTREQEACVPVLEDMRTLLESLPVPEQIPSGVCGDGTNGWICNGASVDSRESDRAPSTETGSRSSLESRPDEEQRNEPRAIFEQQGPQAVRASRFTSADLVRSEVVDYTGIMWCVRVPTGAFVVRRKGKIFVTGNSGFPKSLNISLAIDRKDGVLDQRKIVHSYSASGNAGTSCADKGGTYSVGVENSPPVQLAVTRGATDKSRRFDGFGTALKPASEHWIVARKPLVGTLVDNALTHGTGALNIDACRVATDWNEPDRPDSWKQSGHTADTEADKIAAPPGNGIKCHPAGRFPANFVLTHSAECICVGTEIAKGDDRDQKIGFREGGFLDVGSYIGESNPNSPVYPSTTQLVYDCVDGCPVKLLNEQSGNSMSSGGTPEKIHSMFFGEHSVKGHANAGGLGDSGGASRFFNTFERHPELDEPMIYLAKPSTAEREAGCGALPKRSAGEITGGRSDDGAAQNCPRTGAGRGSGGRHNHHPTLKSIALMTHFIKLVTPPGGVTVSRFLGSGTDACAALLSGFRCIGFEKEPDYFQIAKARVEYWAKRGRPTISKPKTAAVSAKQIDLFSTLGGPSATE